MKKKKGPKEKKIKEKEKLDILQWIKNQNRNRNLLT